MNKSTKGGGNRTGGSAANLVTRLTLLRGHIGCENGTVVTASATCTNTQASSAPGEPGAYILLVRLLVPAPLPGRFAGRQPPLLAPGVYAYCGSARGPGGLRARLARHLRRDKTKRWHIDWLTTVAEDIAALAIPGGDECALRAALADEPGATHPVPGFGSTDCRMCPSHLLRLG